MWVCAQALQTLCVGDTFRPACTPYCVHTLVVKSLPPPPGGYRVLELTAGLMVISIALTPDLRD